MKKLVSFFMAVMLVISLVLIGTLSFAAGAATKAADNSSIAGDVDGDGAITGKDCATVMQYINGYDIDIIVDAADVNDDGKVNSKDYVLMVRYLNGWDVTLTPPENDGGIELPIDKW